MRAAVGGSFKGRQRLQDWYQEDRGRSVGSWGRAHEGDH